MRPSAYRINQLALGILAVFLALVGGMAWQEFRSTEAAGDWVGRTYASMDAIQDLALGLREADSAQHRFIATGDVDALVSYRNARRRLESLVVTLQTSQGGKPTPLAGAIGSVIGEWNQAVEAASLSRAEGTSISLDAAGPVSSMLDAMRHREEALLSWRIGVHDRNAATLRWVVLGGAMVALITLLFSSRMLNHALRDSRISEAEQRAQASRFRTILDSLDQGVGVFSSSGELRESNTRLAQLVDPIDAGMDNSACLAGTPSSPSLDTRRTPMADGGFVLTVTDMTVRVRAEEGERALGKMQAIAHLTGGVAHDFNNILTIILGNLEMFGRKLERTHPLHPRIAMLETAARRGALLTSQLLAFARIQPLAPRMLVLEETLQTMLPALNGVLGPHHVVHVEAERGIWPALVDPNQLEHALLCLVMNAGEAMEGGGTVTIRLDNQTLSEADTQERPGLGKGDYVVLSVTDRGCGMTPDTLARAFDPFFSTKPSGQSRGMGLAMVFGFAKQSGGHAELRSEPGMGTVARLILPRAAQPMPVSGTPTPLLENTASGVSETKGRILMAEDEEALREVVSDMLQEMGYAVVQASSGEDALAVFSTAPEAFDMLLTDVLMPGMDGRELASRITGAKPDMPVLYMSGYTRDAIFHDGRLDHDVRLLNKPFNSAELTAAVALTLSRA